MLRVERTTLPHLGIIPGARGHKKITIPQGTEVWVIKYHELYFHSCYLNEQQALECLHSLAKYSLNPESKRFIPMRELVAWNFRHSFPTRVAREKSK